MLSATKEAKAKPQKQNVFRNIPQLRRKVFIFASCILGVWLLFKLFLLLLPFPELKAFINHPYSTRFYDRNGKLLQVMPLEDGLRREWYDLDALPPSIPQVFIAAEDERFYRHGGVDFFAMFRAAMQNVSQGRRVSGGSTITMQVARLVIPRKKDEKVTLWTKIVEAWNAIRIEAKLSKDEILELYLNNLPFGMQAEGIGSAARTYYGLAPQQLSLSQIHALAVVPRRPATYNPIHDPKASYEAAMIIGEITDFSATLQEWTKAVAVENRYIYPMELPHFISYVENQYKKQEQNLPPQIILSVDAKLTEQAGSLVDSLLEQNKDARLSHGAVFAMDNETGEIICWYGGNFHEENGGQIDGVLVKNQSGSTMKPFIFAQALESGFAPNTILADVPMDFGSQEVYVPLNFNNQYNGPVPMRVALASSLNIPAVYLLYRLGVDNYMEKLFELGFDSLAGERYRTGLSLALGSGEVTLFELTRAFSVFTNKGFLVEPSFFAKDNSGLEQEKELLTKKSKIYEADTAAIICDFLSDKRARSLGFGFADVFNTEYPAIFKTGTSNQFQNIIALGSTAGYTIGVWMGNFSGDTVIRETGSSIPAQVVRQLLDILSEANPDTATSFPEPKKFMKVPVCSLSGMAPGKDCPSITTEFVATTSISNRPSCQWHYNLNGKTETKYPQEYQRWLSGRNNQGSLFDYSELEILYPTDGAVFVYDSTIPSEAQKIRVDATGKGHSASLYINGQFFGSSAQPFVWYVPLRPGSMNITVQLDSSGEKKSVDVLVR